MLGSVAERRERRLLRRFLFGATRREAWAAASPRAAGCGARCDRWCHAISAPLCPSAGKTEFLTMFQALDRKRRGRIAAIDLFSGLALVVDAKKAQKLDCAALNQLEARETGSTHPQTSL